jgi:hypothetical protein
VTLTLNLSTELEQRLQSAAEADGVTPSEYAVKALDEKLSDVHRRQQAMALLRSWRERGDAKQQQQAMEFLIQALDEDRTSDRKLFPPELKGISW